MAFHNGGLVLALPLVCMRLRLHADEVTRGLMQGVVFGLAVAFSSCLVCFYLSCASTDGRTATTDLLLPLSSYVFLVHHSRSLTASHYHHSTIDSPQLNAPYSLYYHFFGTRCSFYSLLYFLSLVSVSLPRLSLTRSHMDTIRTSGFGHDNASLLSSS